MNAIIIPSRLRGVRVCECSREWCVCVCGRKKDTHSDALRRIPGCVLLCSACDPPKNRAVISVQRARQRVCAIERVQAVFEMGGVCVCVCGYNP